MTLKPNVTIPRIIKVNPERSDLKQNYAKIYGNERDRNKTLYNYHKHWQEFSDEKCPVSHRYGAVNQELHIYEPLGRALIICNSITMSNN